MNELLEVYFMFLKNLIEKMKKGNRELRRE